MFVRFMRFLLNVLVIFLCSQHVNCLYEDQIKKFDWRWQNVGELENAFLDLTNAYQHRILVSTKENVLASLCPKSGNIIWRQILEKSPRGQLKLLQKTDTASSTAAVRRDSRNNYDLLSVQGYAPAIVRGWNEATGKLEFEWSLMPNQVDKAEHSIWFFNEGSLYHVIPVWKSHLELTEYIPTSGQPIGTTAKIVAPWISSEQCIQTGPYHACLEGNQLITLDLTESSPQIVKKKLDFTPKLKPNILKEKDGILVIDDTLINVKDSIKICENLVGQSFLTSKYNNKEIVITGNLANKFLQLNVFYLDTCEKIDKLTNIIPYVETIVSPKILSFDCESKDSGNGKSCMFILSTASEAILAVNQNKIIWSRDESLANIVAAEFIDLPLADVEGAIESEMKSKPGDILSAFIRRITGQIHQMKSIFLHVIGLGLPPTETQKAGLVRDSFGLHKMLVVLTKCGKIFGIDNISGKHHWTQFVPEIQNFNNDEKVRLVVQRTSKHFPLQPLCAIVGKDKITGNGLIYRFNPITGTPAEGGLLKLNFKIKQMALLAETEHNFVKGLLLLDEKDEVHVFPESAKEHANGMYLFTADVKTSTLNGFYVKLKDKKLTTTAIWNVLLGGGYEEQHRIMAVAAKNPLERVHSQGRVLGDRSVLYKYINPNLVAVVTQAPDNIHKYIMNLYLIDAVSGAIVFSLTHRKVRAPINIVHSENWLVYSYYNDKVRRTEMTSIELYEGKIQANSTAWSSLNAPPIPLVERQSYIIPTAVRALKETITERGITNKHILIGTTSGAIIEMPWILLDPRRPTTASSQAREDGIIPYVPELPLATENIINYNQTIALFNDIYTAPSGLESTCLVLATGLDIFVTRVSPSKTFDLLKEDFDYILITVVLIALTSGSLVVRHLSARKTLKQAWK